MNSSEQPQPCVPSTWGQVGGFANIPALLDWSLLLFSFLFSCDSGLSVPLCSPAAGQVAVLPPSMHFSFAVPSCSCSFAVGSSWALSPVLSAPSQSPSQTLAEEMAPQKCLFAISAGIPATSLWAESQAGGIFVLSSVI